jgi:hypothetical protein
MNKISIPAVISGAIMDMVATFVLVIPLTFYEMSRHHLLKLQLPPDQAQAAVKAAFAGDITWQLTGFLIGAVGSVIGGYMAGKIAKHNEMLNGSLTCVLCVGFGLISGLRGTSINPTWLHIVTFFLAPALGALGGYIYMIRKQSAAI